MAFRESRPGEASVLAQANPDWPYHDPGSPCHPRPNRPKRRRLVPANFRHAAAGGRGSTRDERPSRPICGSKLPEMALQHGKIGDPGAEPRIPGRAQRAPRGTRAVWRQRAPGLLVSPSPGHTVPAPGPGPPDPRHTGKKTSGGAGTHKVTHGAHGAHGCMDTRITRTNLTSIPHNQPDPQERAHHTHTASPRSQPGQPTEPAALTEPRGRLRKDHSQRYR